MKKSLNINKKIISVILVTLIIFLVCACTESVSNKTKYLDSIYEVESAILETEIEKFNHKNLILDTPIHSTDPKVLTTRKILLNGTEKDMKYCETIFYPISDTSAHKYLVNGVDNNVILLNDDGSVTAILFTFTKLDMSSVKNGEEIKPILMSVLEDFVDLSKYQYVDITGDENENYDSIYVIYDFLYYNMENGYITDFTKVSVSYEGEVFGFSINDLNADNLSLNVDKSLENELLSMKLKDIYDTPDTKYESFDIEFTPNIVRYDGELFVNYFVAVNYIKTESGNICSSATKILLPLRLISSADK